MPVSRKNSKNRRRDARGRFLPKELEPQPELSAAGFSTPANRSPIIGPAAAPQHSRFHNLPIALVKSRYHPSPQTLAPEKAGTEEVPN
jgi:hypothetical protein